MTSPMVKMRSWLQQRLAHPLSGRLAAALEARGWMPSPRWRKRLSSRYTLVLVYVALWLLFFDKYDVLSHGRLARRIAALEQERRLYRREIYQLRQEQNILAHDPQAIERVAREAYYMKRPDEDVFLILEKAK